MLDENFQEKLIKLTYEVINKKNKSLREWEKNESTNNIKENLLIC